VLQRCVRAADGAAACGRGAWRQRRRHQEYRLANGLQVLLVPDDSKPTTTVNVTYHVGSRMENYGETGMAHLLEHLLFKGTPTTEPEVWGEFARRGLRANGTTRTTAQLLRQLLGQRRHAALVPRLAGRRDGQQLHRAQGPRHRDDGGAQRDGARREQPEPRADPADDGVDVLVAQLWQGHHRRARRHREREHRAPAGVLSQYYQPDKRHADRGRRASTPPARWRWMREAFGPIAKPRARCSRPTRSIRRKTASAA
jgi:hypothetical protein